MDKKYIYGAFIALGSIAFVGCSSDNDEVEVLNVEETVSNAFKVIKVGAPAIVSENSSSAGTRVSLADTGSGVSLTWDADDTFRIFHSNGTSYRDYKTTEGGATAEFVKQGSDGDIAAGSNTIIYPSSVGTNVSKWDSWSVSAEQTQADDANTDHLKAYYAAKLAGLSDYTGLTFSTTYASGKGGTFVQSSVLKLKLTLPSTTDIKEVTKVEVEASDAIFNLNNGGTSKTNKLTLNFTQVTSADQTLEGYIILPAVETDFGGKTITIRVYVDHGNYIYRSMKFNAGQTLRAGYIGEFKLGANNWTNIWTFESNNGATYKQMTNKDLFNGDGSGYKGVFYGHNALTTNQYLGISTVGNGMYLICGEADADNKKIKLDEKISSFNVEIGGETLVGLRQPITTTKTSISEDFESNLKSSTWRPANNNSITNFRSSVGINVLSAGTLYVCVQMGENDKDLYIGYQNKTETSESRYTSKTQRITDANTTTVVSLTTPEGQSGEGVFYITGSSKYTKIYAVKFVPKK